MSEIFSKRFDYVILGGGSAGCTLANRLSADRRSQVALIEAGKDYPPGTEPADIRSSYALGAAFNPAYHWSDLKVRLSHTPTNEPDRRTSRFMEQARVVGGGSSINAQMANRGSPLDYDEWDSLGARGLGLGRRAALFQEARNRPGHRRRLSREGGSDTGAPRAGIQWTDFSRAVSQALTNDGLKPLPDQNGYFEDGLVRLRDLQQGRAAGVGGDGVPRRRGAHADQPPYRSGNDGRTPDLRRQSGRGRAGPAAGGNPRDPRRAHHRVFRRAAHPALADALGRGAGGRPARSRHRRGRRPAGRGSQSERAPDAGRLRLSLQRRAAPHAGPAARPYRVPLLLGCGRLRAGRHVRLGDRQVGLAPGGDSPGLLPDVVQQALFARPAAADQRRSRGRARRRFQHAVGPADYER